MPREREPVQLANGLLKHAPPLPALLRVARRRWISVLVMLGVGRRIPLLALGAALRGIERAHADRRAVALVGLIAQRHRIVGRVRDDDRGGRHGLLRRRAAG